MKTLLLESDPVKARSWAMRFEGPCDDCDLARSPAQARLMLIGGHYDRLCLRLETLNGRGAALLTVARAMNANCEIVDLSSKTCRPVSGPSRGGVLRQDSAVDVVSL